MVDWIDKFELLLRRVKDSWMDMLPFSSMTEQQRESQYQADIARLNAERQSSSGSLRTKDHMWLPTEVYFHSVIT